MYITSHTFGQYRLILNGVCIAESRDYDALRARVLAHLASHPTV